MFDPIFLYFYKVIFTIYTNVEQRWRISVDRVLFLSASFLFFFFFCDTIQHGPVDVRVTYH